MEEKLTERMKLVLRIIVDNYIKTNGPMGSRALIKRYSLGFSPATLRNVMCDLEEMGYLTHTYTSGGKIPTQKAYKFYINHVISNYKPRGSKEIERAFKKKRLDELKEITQLLNHISDIISTASGFISLSNVLSVSRMHLKGINFIRIDSNMITVVAVSSNGLIRARTVPISLSLTQEKLDEIAEFIMKYYSGLSLTEVRRELVRDITSTGRACRELIDDLIEQTKNGEVVVSGIKNIFNFKEFVENIEKLRNVLKVLEEKKLIVDLLNDVIEHNKRIIIGDDFEIEDLDDMGFVGSVYEGKCEPLGAIGVIGPINMDYGEILNLVDFASRRINETLFRFGGEYDERSED